ncbi:copper resistance protein CopC [Intrasporangium sp.]|uniref:copper resistance CopC/CopD family protein n=1 Tax=Intrasporangium sp. TaxID=1925024 RepID=UPI003365AB06
MSGLWACIRRSARVATPGVSVALVVLGAILALVFGGGSAVAHSGLERSDPANGGMVAPGRTTMRLWFSDPVDDASTFVVRPTDPPGPPLRATVTIDETEMAVRVSTPPLERGRYELMYHVISTGDAHRTSGRVEFGAGTRPAAGAAGPSSSDPIEGVVRWFDLVGVVVAIGVVTSCRRCVRALAASRSAPSYAAWVSLRRRALVVGILASTTAVVAGALTPVVRVRSGGASADWAGATGNLLTTSPWGPVWLAREVALVAAVLALWRLWSAPERLVPDPVTGTDLLAAGEERAPNRSRPAAVAVGALVTASVLDGAAGHASTLHDGALLATLASAGHLLAAGVWSGGLVSLVLAIPPAMRRRFGREPALGPVWRAFGPLAAAASVVLVATGLYSAGRHVDDVNGMTSTAYGVVVLAKSLLLAIALGLAAYNTLTVRPGLAARVHAALRGGRVRSTWRGHLAATVVLEAAVLLLALGWAAALTTMPTAHDTAAVDRVAVSRVAMVDGLFVTLEAMPEGSGLRYVVRARSVVRPEPGPVTGVDVTVLPEPSPASEGSTTTSRTTLLPVEEGRFEAFGPASAVRWTALVSVQRERAPAAIASIAGLQPVEADRSGTLRTPATVVAVLLMAVLVLALLEVTRRSGRRDVIPGHRSVDTARRLVSKAPETDGATPSASSEAKEVRS